MQRLEDFLGGVAKMSPPAAPGWVMEKRAVLVFGPEVVAARWIKSSMQRQVLRGACVPVPRERRKAVRLMSQASAVTHTPVAPTTDIAKELLQTARQQVNSFVLPL